MAQASTHLIRCPALLTDACWWAGSHTHQQVPALVVGVHSWEISVFSRSPNFVMLGEFLDDVM